MGLANDDIARIVSNPRVGRPWARMANLKYEDLRRGAPKIVLRLRAAITRDPAAFVHSLATGWDNLLDDDDKPDEQFDELALRAIAAGFMLGPRAGAALVHAVADSDLLHAAEVSERLEELVERATNPPNHGEEGWPSGLTIREDPSLDGQDDEDDQDDSEADVTDESAALIGLAAKLVAQQDGAREAVLPEMRSLGARMQAEAGTLVNRLRAAATAIEQGRPAEQLGLAADNWSVSVGILLGGAEALDIDGVEDLHTLVARLTELDAEHTERVAKRLADAQVAEELIEVLQRQGRAAMIEANLTQLGFTSIDEVKAVLAGADSGPVRAVVDAGPSSEARGDEGAGEDEAEAAAEAEEERAAEELQAEAAEAVEEEETEEAEQAAGEEDPEGASGGGEQSGADPVAEDSATCCVV